MALRDPSDVEESSAPGVSLKDLSAAEYSRLSTSWDESIEMGPEARETWLAALEVRRSRRTAMRVAFRLTNVWRCSGKS
jgi:hypothetical protein